MSELVTARIRATAAKLGLPHLTERSPATWNGPTPPRWATWTSSTSSWKKNSPSAKTCRLTCGFTPPGSAALCRGTAARPLTGRFSDLGLAAPGFRGQACGGHGGCCFPADCFRR